MKLPKVLCTSVLRSAHKGDSHGGCYLVDLETEKIEQKLDWNNADISWQGRGGDRGLRGVCFHNDLIILAASDEILFYNQNFELLESYTNKFLKHCHEIFLHKNSLFLTSCGYDSILEFDLNKKRFIKGYHIKKNFLKRFFKIPRIRILPKISVFNPESNTGPAKGDVFHINNTSFSNECLTISGTALDHLLFIKNGTICDYAKIPFGTHNAQPLYDGFIANDTASNCISYFKEYNRVLKSFLIVKYDEKELIMNNLPDDYARQGFGRGLCFYENLVIGGSSPATISVYSFEKERLLKSVNITKDVRNSIHGLEIWPY